MSSDEVSPNNIKTYNFRAKGIFISCKLRISHGYRNQLVKVNPSLNYRCICQEENHTHCIDADPPSNTMMAKDGLFIKKVAQIHPRFRTPAFAIIIQAVWASLLALLVLALLADGAVAIVRILRGSSLGPLTAVATLLSPVS